MDFKKVFSVIKREFLESVMKKSFIILTILTPLIFGALLILPSLFWMIKGEKKEKIVVFDRTNKIEPFLKKVINEKEKNESKEKLKSDVEFIFISERENMEKYLNSLSQQKSSIDGLLEIKNGEKGEFLGEYYGKNIGNIKLLTTLEKYLNDSLLRLTLKEKNVDEEVINELEKKFNIKAIKIEKGGKKKESSFLSEYLKTFILTMFLYMMIISYGQTLMRGVMEEKNSRVIELLLSSLNAKELMLGKIIGLASVGLFQYFIWFILGLIMYFSNPLNFTSRLEKGVLSIDEVILFLIFFILGYFFYASIFAAGGSICSTEQEVQQIMFPISIILIFPIIILGLVLQNPNATWLVILSFIPLFTPTLMMARISLVSVPPIQIVFGIIILILGIISMAYIGGKIYRIAILMTGKRPNIFEILKWLKTS